MSVRWKTALEESQTGIRRSSLWRSRRELCSPQKPRVVIGQKQLINFSSNDYLGLANNAELIKVAQNAAEQWGVASGASHLVCGHQTPHQQLEHILAEFVGAQRAVLFSTGYMANLALAGLADKRDLILQDKLNHASLIDGARLSRAQFKRYAHSDLDHAAGLLKSSEFDKAMLMTDGVFSMDGDVAKLRELKQLADQHQALLVVDDAHGFACLGETGRGSLELSGLRPKDNVLLMATLGKAVGSFGAFVAGDAIYIEQLVQAARSYIYTTAIPPNVVQTSKASIELIDREGTGMRALLNERVEQFKNGAQDLRLQLMPSYSAIQPMVLGEESDTLAFSKALYEKGFLVTAIRPPTVPRGTARLRFTFSASHTQAHVGDLLEAIAAVAKEHDVNHG